MNNVMPLSETDQQAVHSQFEFNQQAKALKIALESASNFPNNLNNLTLQDTQELLSRMYGFQNWGELNAFVKKTENHDLVNQHIDYISSCFIYLADAFQNNFDLESHLFKSKETFSNELIECSTKIRKIASAVSHSKKPSKKVISDICDLVKKYCYCFIATKKSSQYNNYINSLYETEFFERLSQLKPDEGLNKLGIEDLQFLMTHEIKSTPQVYLLSSTRELAQGNESRSLLKKIVCMLVFCMSKYNNGFEMQGVPILGYYDLKDLCKPYCIEDEFYDGFGEKNHLNFSSYQMSIDEINTKAEQLKLLLKSKSKKIIENKKLSINSALQIISELCGYKNWQILSALSSSDNEINLSICSADYIQKYLKYASKYIESTVAIPTNDQSDEIFLSKEELIKSLESLSSKINTLKQHYMHKAIMSHELVRLICNIVAYYLYYYICSFIGESYLEFIDDMWGMRDAALIKDFEPENDLSCQGISKLQYFISDHGDLPNLSLLLQASREFREVNKSTRMMNRVIGLLAFCMMQENPSAEYDLTKRPMDFELENQLKKNYFLCDRID